MLIDQVIIHAGLTHSNIPGKSIPKPLKKLKREKIE